MTKEIKTAIDIQAAPEKIWSILIHFEDYPDWNPFITSVKGQAEEGNRLTVKINPPQGKAMTFKPVIIRRTENKELKWLGKLLITGLFDGEHSFELTGNGNGTTTFIHSEKFRGLLVGMINLEKTRKGFEEMNLKLKELAER